jgi:hypothetical protein
MTTAARRARKKANRREKLAVLEQLAVFLDEADALAGLSDEELAEVTVTRERPESEKAAAMQALGALRKLRKRIVT